MRKINFQGTWPNQHVYDLDGSVTFQAIYFANIQRHVHTLKNNIKCGLTCRISLMGRIGVYLLGFFVGGK